MLYPLSGTFWFLGATGPASMDTFRSGPKLAFSRRNPCALWMPFACVGGWRRESGSVFVPGPTGYHVATTSGW